MPVELGKSKIPKGMRVYAVGDIHGCLDELKTIISMIGRDLQNNPVKDYRIVFLGDYMDRGPRSKPVISYLMAMMARDKRVVCLRGNHDLALSQFIANPVERGPLFFRNGGLQTLQSYGVAVTDRVESSHELLELASFLEVLLNTAHLLFLEKLPYQVSYGDYYFCHAGVRPGVALKDQDTHDLIWIRREFIEHRKPFEKVIVHGHTARRDVDVRNNAINIDTTCHASGILTSVALEGTRYRFLQTGASSREA